MSDPWLVVHMPPRIAICIAQHKLVNILKTRSMFFCNHILWFSQVDFVDDIVTPHVERLGESAENQKARH